ncbi:MAG: outer membrane protein insertion porin family [Flavobacteriales bacterium]|jgi:outer membrane protein insertion porin family
MKRLLFFVGLLVLAVRVHADSFTVADIRLEGLQRVSASPVFAALSIRVGDTIDSEDVRQNIQSLFRTGFFSNVQIARDDEVLIVILQELPAIKSITLEGNKAIKDEQLEGILTDNDLTEGEILQLPLLQNLARELERTYIGQARYGAKVDANVTDIDNNMVDVVIEIDEGKAAKIQHINFVGNTVFDDEQLHDLFELAETHWAKFFSSSDKYAKEKLAGDIETLESFYLNQGYLDFSVISSQISMSADKKSVFITLNLNEGEVYSINEVDISGDPILPVASVYRLLLLRKGMTFSQARMDNSSEYISTLLGNAGYTNATVEGIPEKTGDGNSVNLTFFIDPGQRVYVRRIEFSGNTKTTDSVLRREARQLESSSASNSRIEQTKVRLERLGFFKGVEVETTPVPGVEDLLDVEYTVEEQASGTISASLGYAAFSGLNLGASIQQNNWMGTGKQVNFGVTKNLYQTAYNFGYTDPYFTPDGVSRGFSLFYNTRDTSRLSVSRYSADTYGGAVSFGYPFSEISRLQFSFGLEHQSITPGNSLVPQEIVQTTRLFSQIDTRYVNQSDLINYDGEGIIETHALTTDMLADVEPGFIDKFGTEFDNASFNMAWRRVTLNRGILATRGSSQSLNFEVTAPGSGMEFYKLIYDAQAFRPLGRHFTLRLRTKLGYGDGYGSMDELPFFENFYSGGFGSVRGFEKSSLGPRGSPGSNYLVQSNVGSIDLNRDGLVSGAELTGLSAYILCDDSSLGAVPPGQSSSGEPCDVGRLMTGAEAFDATLNGRSSFNQNSFGGNILVEFGTELILPIPFVEDSRSMQLVAFIDAGNVFSSYCRDTQINCSNVDLGQLSSTAGFGFTWLSGMGPMTFSFAKALQESEFDDREVFSFTFGAGF